MAQFDLWAARAPPPVIVSTQPKRSPRASPRPPSPYRSIALRTIHTSRHAMSRLCSEVLTPNSRPLNLGRKNEASSALALR